MEPATYASVNELWFYAFAAGFFFSCALNFVVKPLAVRLFDFWSK